MPQFSAASLVVGAHGLRTQSALTTKVTALNVCIRHFYMKENPILEWFVSMFFARPIVFPGQPLTPHDLGPQMTLLQHVFLALSPIYIQFDMNKNR